METATLVPHRLKVRLGPHEFDGEGEKETVKEQYEMWLQAITAMPNAGERRGANATPNTANKIEEVDDEVEALWNRAYKRSDNSVSLNVLPQTKAPNPDAILLLIYGFHALLKQEFAKATDLMDAAKQSGLRIDRVDRLPSDYNALIIKGGNGKGSRYSLNNRGLARAQELLEQMFE
jgi:hypothetical protein